GTDLVHAAGTDLDTIAGTDLDSSAGTDLDISVVTDLVSFVVTDLEHPSANRSRPSSFNQNLDNSVLRFSLDFVKSRERFDSFPGFNQRFVKSCEPGSESRPPMLNKENYVPWKMIPEPGDANRDITVTETFHLQTEDELSDKELKQIEADDQAIQTILLGLPEDIYAAVDSCKSAQEIWL
nr:hypothetical protein [Tanacetum cinerariifolium]